MAEENTEEVDVEALQRLNVEYAAALTALLGDDFDTILNDNLVTRRDGTVQFIAPDPEPEGSKEEESSSKEEPPSTMVGEGKERKPVSKLPSAFAGRNQSETKPVYTDEAIMAMSPAEFLKNKEAIYASALGDS